MVYDDFQRLHERLDNWAHVVRCGVIRHHCGSAEGRYQPRYPDTEPVKCVLDYKDAWRIETAWRKIRDEKSKILLKRYYVDNTSAGHHLPTDADFVVALRQAISALFLALG
jgi:hypothetical protein